MAGWKEYAHEIRKRADDYPSATVQHVAIYAKDNNRVYIIDENGALVDFQVADIFCYNIDVSQTAEVGETLSVSGNGYFWSDLSVEDNTYIGGIVDVSGNGYFWNDVIIDGNLLVNSNVAIGENLEVSGNGYFYGDVVMGDDLEVAGNVVIGEDLEVVGDASISGSLYIVGKLTVDGLIDPTGLQLTPISANPGDSNTIWVDPVSGAMFGASEIITKSKLFGGSEPLRVDEMPLHGSTLDLDNYDAFIWDALTGNRTVTLPLINKYKGRVIYLKQATGGTPRDVTINCSGANTFDNAVLTKTLGPWNYLILLAGSSRWYTISAG